MAMTNLTIKAVCPLIILAASLVLSNQARAQSVADEAAGQLERDRAADERQRQLEKNRLDYPPPAGTEPAPPATEAAREDEACLQINSISVTGVTLLRAEAVRAITPCL